MAKDNKVNIVYERMTINQLNHLSDELDVKLAPLHKEKKAVHLARCKVIAETEAAKHGLTAKEYAEAKKEASAAKIMMAIWLREKFRRENLQGARPS